MCISLRLRRALVPALLLVCAGATPALGQGTPTAALGPTTLKLPDAPGSVAGLADPATLDVFSGQVGYSVPIRAPAAGGITPALAIEYSGALGNGLLGVGWNLRVPVIRRSLREGVPAYSDDDELILEGIGGGGRLVAIGGGEFRVEGQGNTVRVRRAGPGWVVHDGDGVAYVLGAKVEERQSDGSRVAAWFAHSVTNTAGEEVLFSWTQSEGAIYPARVEWGPAKEFQLQFEWEARPDPVVSYQTGFRVQTKLRLAVVSVEVKGQILRRYRLTYDDERPMSRLARVRVTGRGDEGELPALSFTYAGGDPARVEALAGTDGWALDERGVTFADVDGDGVDDLLRLEMGNHEWRRNLGGVFDERAELSGAEAVELEGSRLLDLDGDARPELVRIVDDTWRAYRLAGDAWVPLGTWPGTDGVPLAEGGGVVLADLNGDGRTDVMEAVTGGIRVRRATAAGLAVPFVVGPVSASDPYVEPGQPGVLVVDYNGDGLADVVWLTDAWMKVFLGRGDGSFEVLDRVFYPWGAGAFDLADLILADLNRDGLIDLVRVVAGNVLYYAGRGNHRFADGPRHVARPEAAAADVLVTIADANGNGSADLVWSSPRGMWALDLAGATSAGMLETIDNGLGLSTIFAYEASGLLAIDAEQAGQAWTRKLPVSIPVPIEMRAVFADGMTPTRVERYGVADGFWDGVERRFGGFLVGRRALPGAAAAEARVEETRYLAGQGASRVLRGRAWYVRVEDGLGRVYSVTETDWEARRVTGPQELPDVPLLRRAVVTETRSSAFEGVTTPIETRSTYEYDGEGRVVEGHDYGRTDLSGDERILHKTWASDDGTWVRDRLIEQTLRDGAGALVEQKQIYYGDELGPLPWGTVGNGWPAATDGWLTTGPSSPRWVRLGESRYDARGNIVAAYAEGTWRTIEWTPDGLYPVRETLAPNPGEELAWVMTWDEVLGLPTSLTDPNGDATSIAYDPLGRPVAISQNGGPAHARFEYAWAAPRPQTISYTFDGAPDALPALAGAYAAGAPWRQTVTVANGGGESLYAAVRLDAAQWIISGWKDRDGRGRAVAVVDPFDWAGAALPATRPTDAKVVQTIAYDVLDRVVEVRLATGARTLTGYGAYCGTTTTDDLAPVLSCSDGLGRAIHTERVVSGVAEEVDATYDAAGRIVSMRLQGGIVEHSFAYDSLGRLVGAIDPDIGLRVMQYDDAGRLLRHTNGAGQHVYMDYDGAGRLTRRWADDGTSFAYHYDARYGGATGGHVRGRLAWVEEPTGRVEVLYDAFGRSAMQSRTIDGTSATQELVLSPSGLLLGERHDDGFEVARGYDAAGRLVSARTESLTLWQVTRQDAAGRVLEESFGNGLSTVITNDVLGQPQQITLSHPSGEALYDVELARNAYGAVTSAIDHDGARLDHTATFGYDGAGRLVDATMGVGEAAYYFTYTYDGLQNMIARAASGPRDLGLLQGAYRYGEAGAGPRQLTSVVAPTRMRISTIAGGGVDTVDGGPATAAALLQPGGLGATGDGGLALAEQGRHRVRKIGPTGLISTAAGDGTAGFAGDGGAATAARLNLPAAVSPGQDGVTLYVADTANHRVRKVAPDGTISTIAGTGVAGFTGDRGPATSAQLSNPRDVIEASRGVLYIADTGNHRVRGIVGGTVVTVAGGGLGGITLSSPSGLALSPSGELYIADTGNHRVLKLAGGVVSVVAGTGAAGFAGDRGPAKAARLSSPRDVAVAADGSLYIADTGNHRIRKVMPDGTISTVAGTGDAASSGDGGLAMDAALNAPVGLAIAPSGALYVAEDAGGRARMLTPETPETTFAYDAAGRQVRDGATLMTYNGLDQLVSVLPGGAAPGVEYGYGFDGQRIKTLNPGGEVEYWFTPELRERAGRRERYVNVGNRIIARVTLIPPPTGGTSTGGLLAPRPLDPRKIAQAMMLAMALALAGAVLAPRRRRRRLYGGVASLCILAILAPACAVLSESERPVWSTTETIYYHQGFGAGPVLMTSADGSVMEERRHEPFGQPLDAYRASGGTGLIDYSFEPHNALNKPTDSTTGWSYHGARWMAPQSARWLTPDPPVKAPNPGFMAAPWALHPYQYVEQNPVIYWDPDGAKPDGIGAWEVGEFCARGACSEDDRRIVRQALWAGTALGTAAIVAVYGAAAAISAWGVKAVFVYIVEEAAETTFEAVTGIPVIVGFDDLAEYGVKKFAKWKLRSLSSREVGAIGEDAARKFLAQNGYTDIIAIQNASGHGIDLIGRKGDSIGVFEVKTTKGLRGRKPPDLKPRQKKGMDWFANDVLEQARKQTGRYEGIPDEMAEAAARYQADILAGAPVTGSVIGINLSERSIFVSRWARQTD